MRACDPKNGRNPCLGLSHSGCWRNLWIFSISMDLTEPTNKILNKNSKKLDDLTSMTFKLAFSPRWPQNGPSRFSFKIHFRGCWGLEAISEVTELAPQWSKWPKFVSLHYWRALRGARGAKKSGQPNWSPLWWVGALKFSQTWRKCEILSKLNKNCQRNPVFQRFFKCCSIWVES